MAEYIDRNKIQYREIVDYCDEQNMCNVYCDVADKVKIDRLPTADVVEREKIDKAIEEIANYRDFHKDEAKKSTPLEQGYYLGFCKCLEIIKRNIESEE